MNQQGARFVYNSPIDKDTFLQAAGSSRSDGSDIVHGPDLIGIGFAKHNGQDTSHRYDGSKALGSLKSPFLNLPLEIFLSIAEWSLAEPWPAHDIRVNEESTTANNNRRLQHVEISSLLKSTEDDDDHTSLSPEKSLYPAKALLRLSLTCKDFWHIIMHNQTVDRTLWKIAARSYFDLPAELSEVQGYKHCTSWRNVFRAFYNFELPVDSFGHNKRCKSSLTWAEYCIHKSCSDTVNDRLSLLCIQSGPDVFSQTYDRDSDSYTLDLGLLGGHILLHVDGFGNFSNRAKMEKHLIKSSRGQFPADIFEVVDDRFTIVKVTTSSESHLTVPQTVDVLCTWNLSQIPGILSDTAAKVARCCSHNESLLFTLFRSNDQDPTTRLLDPAECHDLHYIALASNYHMVPGEQSRNIQQWTKTLEYFQVGRSPYPNLGISTDIKSFQSTEEDASLDKPDYLVCNMQLSKSFAAVLVRWRKIGESQEIHDEDCRQFYIISTENASVLQILQLPHLLWDFRHDDMCQKYSEVRLSKLRKLYNIRDAEHRSTRVHEDQFILSEYTNPHSSIYGRIISGSHDYCIWVWNIDFKDKDEPDHVLDDYYWDSENQPHSKHAPSPQSQWNTKQERAGWWCDTPNQILDFWHNFTQTPNSERFGACRAGKLFIWDLAGFENDKNKNKNINVEAYTCLSKPDDNCEAAQISLPDIQDFFIDLDSILPSSDIDVMSLSPVSSSSSTSNPISPQPEVRKLRTDRYLGRSKNPALNHQFRNWFEWKSRIPEQGLWMVFESSLVVYLDREEILKASGLADRRWTCSEDDFEPVELGTTAC